MNAAMRLQDDSDAIPFILVGGLVSICPFMLFSLLPAILISQERNGVYTELCPKAISSSIPGVYALIWGLPFAIFSIFKLLDRYCVQHQENNQKKEEKREEINIFFFLTMVSMYTLWLSMTQLSIHFNGTFRTSIGRLLCWPGTIAAFILVVFSSFASILLIVIDIMKIYSYFGPEDTESD